MGQRRPIGYPPEDLRAHRIGKGNSLKAIAVNPRPLAFLAIAQDARLYYSMSRQVQAGDAQVINNKPYIIAMWILGTSIRFMRHLPDEFLLPAHAEARKRYMATACRVGEG